MLRFDVVSESALMIIAMLLFVLLIQSGKKMNQEKGFDHVNVCLNMSNNTAQADSDKKQKKSTESNCMIDIEHFCIAQ